jgi:hypothetical protein
MWRERCVGASVVAWDDLNIGSDLNCEPIVSFSLVPYLLSTLLSPDMSLHMSCPQSKELSWSKNKIKSIII